MLLPIKCLFFQYLLKIIKYIFRIINDLLKSILKNGLLTLIINKIQINYTNKKIIYKKLIFIYM